MTSGKMVLAAALMALGLSLAAGAVSAQGLSAPPPGTDPKQFGGPNQTEMWRSVRQGEAGLTTQGNRQAGVLIQADGEGWRNSRNGPVSEYGVWALGGIVGVLALFFVLRGRIRIDGPRTGRTVERFGAVERGAHWLTAGSFIVLALTGLNLLYGRQWLLPLLGPETFAAMAGWGKLAHNFVGFAFMAGVLAILLLWVRHNLPDRTDLPWLLRAGGLFSKGVHPPARKFNAGQKLIFWATVIGGVALSYTGVQLMFPFRFAGLADLQFYQLIHAGTALALVVVIVAHIYIGSLGMEGAFDAMGSGQVEEEWAREHHSLWLAEVKGEIPPRRPRTHGHGPAPAE